MLPCPPARANLLSPKRAPGTFRFGEWGKGEIFEWYQAQRDLASRNIEKVQIWKIAEVLIPGWCIVLHMRNGEIHRFRRLPNHLQDRDLEQLSATEPANTQPPALCLQTGVSNNVDFPSPVGVESIRTREAGEQGKTPVHPTNFNLFSNRTVPTEDTYELGINFYEMRTKGECEVEVILQRPIDIMAAISIYYAISNDKETRYFSFFRFNDLFFSWTILIAISRHNQLYEIPSPDLVVEQFYSAVNELSNIIAKETTDLLLGMAVDTLTAFWHKGGILSGQGTGARERLAWGMPIGVLRFFWRQLFNNRLCHRGLRKRLRDIVKKRLLQTFPRMQVSSISHQISKYELNKHLWVEDVGPLVKQIMRVDASKIFWQILFESISLFLELTSQEEIIGQINDSSLEVTLLGKNVGQFYLILCAALQGALHAVKNVNWNVGAEGS